MSATTTKITRRSTSKWHPPPPPSPKILHLPRRLKLPWTFKSKKPGNHRNLRSFIAEENRNGTANARDNGRWRAEAEALREERELLRMERDVALEKLEKTRERKKIDGCDGIEKRMGNLKVRSRGVDEEAHHVREIREVEESSTSANNEHETNVEVVKRKMEGISKGMQARMEEYGSSLLVSNHSAQNYNICEKQRRIGSREVAEEKTNKRQIKGCKCCCKCKEIVIRIAEEVNAESKQWTEIQTMLDQVRLEMEDLKSSRDLWQRRAVDLDFNFRALYPHMVEWKRRARTSENKVIELQKRIFELEKPLRDEAVCLIDFSHSQNLHSENMNTVVLPKIKCQQVEKDKRAPVCRRSNNSKSNFTRRPPLREIGNLS